MVPTSPSASWAPPDLAGPPLTGLPDPVRREPAADGPVASEELEEPVTAIWAVFVSTMAHVVLAGVLWMALWATLPRLVGWQPTVITGGSMRPLIQAGDIVVTRPVSEGALVPGAVITFEDPTRPGSLVTHRVVEVTTTGLLRTRGDDNATDDSALVAPDSVRGRAVLRVPRLGMPLLWMQQTAWVPLAATVILLAALSWIVVKFPL